MAIDFVGQAKKKVYSCRAVLTALKVDKGASDGELFKLKRPIDLKNGDKVTHVLYAGTHPYFCANDKVYTQYYVGDLKPAIRRELMEQLEEV